MMMEYVKILLFTFFSTALNTIPYNCCMYCNTSDTFFLDTLFKKIGCLTWRYRCGVSGLPAKIFNFMLWQLRRISNIFLMQFTYSFRGRKQREKIPAWEAFVVTITYTSLRSFLIRIFFQSHNLKIQTIGFLCSLRPLKV